MKKQLVASLAAAMVLGVAGTSFAATNPFVDVPAKHWAYDSVTKLAQAGIVDGYSNGQYQGDKTISRYEMAQIVAKAMAKSDKADASNKAIIDKLSVEFASELEGLNVRVTKLEDKVGNVTFTGVSRLRYDHEQYEVNGTKLNAATPFTVNVELQATAKINDEWKAVTLIEARKDLRTDKDQANGLDDKTANVKNAYVQGPIMGLDTKVGRVSLLPAQGLVFDGRANGVDFAFGNVVKANVFYGKFVNDTNGAYANALAMENDRYLAAEFKYATSKVTNVTAVYHNASTATHTGNNKNINVWELAADTALSNDFKLSGSYAKSNVDAQVGQDSQNKAFAATLSYKGTDIKKVGSYGAYLTYAKIEAQSVYATTYDIDPGTKGYEIGATYVPAKNILLTTRYIDEKVINSPVDVKGKKFRAQAEFFF